MKIKVHLKNQASLISGVSGFDTFKMQSSFRTTQFDPITGAFLKLSENGLAVRHIVLLSDSFDIRKLEPEVFTKFTNWFYTNGDFKDNWNVPIVDSESKLIDKYSELL